MECGELSVQNAKLQRELKQRAEQVQNLQQQLDNATGRRASGTGQVRRGCARPCMLGHLRRGPLPMH